MRDPLKDEAYFSEYIRFQDTAIGEFEELLETVIGERGADDEGVRNGYIALSAIIFLEINFAAMGIGMMKNVFLLVLIVIGAFMVVITSNKLGEQGNRVMTFMGSIIYLSAVFSILYLSRKRDQDQ